MAAIVPLNHNFRRGMALAPCRSEFKETGQGNACHAVIQSFGHEGRSTVLSTSSCKIQPVEWEPEMKATFKAIFLAAILLGPASSALAASWIQASSTEEQLANDPKPKVVVMNSTDGAKNIKMDKGIVTVNESGAFFIIAAAQVGGKAKGLVRMWIRVNGKDVDNSNTEQLIGDPAFTAVLVSQGVAELKRGDKVTVAFSGSEPGVGLVVKKPAGEPVVPSIIFTGWKID
jgi:hypothetical protein